jgi:hypothetical protein
VPGDADGDEVLARLGSRSGVVTDPWGTALRIVKGKG